MERRLNEKLVLFVAAVLTGILVMIGRAYACDHYSEWDDACMLCEQRQYLMNEMYYDCVRYGKEEGHFMITPTNTGFSMRSIDTIDGFYLFADMVHNKAFGQYGHEIIDPQDWYWWEDEIF